MLRKAFVAIVVLCCLGIVIAAEHKGTFKSYDDKTKALVITVAKDKDKTEDKTISTAATTKVLQKLKDKEEDLKGGLAGIKADKGKGPKVTVTTKEVEGPDPSDKTKKIKSEVAEKVVVE